MSNRNELEEKIKRSPDGVFSVEHRRLSEDPIQWESTVKIELHGEKYMQSAIADGKRRATDAACATILMSRRMHMTGSPPDSPAQSSAQPNAQSATYSSVRHTAPPLLVVDLESVPLKAGSLMQLVQKYEVHIFHSRLHALTPDLRETIERLSVRVHQIDSAVRDAADVGICVFLGEQRIRDLVNTFPVKKERERVVLTRDHFGEVVQSIGSALHITSLKDLEMVEKI